MFVKIKLQTINCLASGKQTIAYWCANWLDIEPKGPGSWWIFFFDFNSFLLLLL
jgi:hypothetical protein